MEYAVIKIGGSQYKVKEGEEITVEKLPYREGEEVEFPEVLLVIDNKEPKIGQPVVEGAKIRAKIVSHLKGEKIRVARFKAKARYRKVRGFRPSLTKIKILKIDIGKGNTTPDR